MKRVFIAAVLMLLMYVPVRACNAERKFRNFIESAHRFPVCKSLKFAKYYNLIIKIH